MKYGGNEAVLDKFKQLHIVDKASLVWCSSLHTKHQKVLFCQLHSEEN